MITIYYRVDKISQVHPHTMLVDEEDMATLFNILSVVEPREWEGYSCKSFTHFYKTDYSEGWHHGNWITNGTFNAIVENAEIAGIEVVVNKDFIGAYHVWVQ